MLAFDINSNKVRRPVVGRLTSSYLLDRASFHRSFLLNNQRLCHIDQQVPTTFLSVLTGFHFHNVNMCVVRYSGTWLHMSASSLSCPLVLPASHTSYKYTPLSILYLEQNVLLTIGTIWAKLVIWKGDELWESLRKYWMRWGSRISYHGSIMSWWHSGCWRWWPWCWSARGLCGWC